MAHKTFLLDTHAQKLRMCFVRNITIILVFSRNKYLGENYFPFTTFNRCCYSNKFTLAFIIHLDLISSCIYMNNLKKYFECCVINKSYTNPTLSFTASTSLVCLQMYDLKENALFLQRVCLQETF